MRFQRIGCLILPAILVCLAMASGASGQQKHTWELQNGVWTQVETPTTNAVQIAEPTLDQAELLLFQANTSAAKHLLLKWEKANKKSPVRDRCISLLADAFFQEDSRVKSFYYLDELMDEYPESPLFTSALQRQYQIADAYLGGYKRTFLWFKILDAGEEGVIMMYRIQQRSPGSPLAEKALLRTADFYFSSQDYDLAEDAYNAYIRSYPRSPDVPRVQLRAAFSSLAQYRGVRFDATAIIDARTQLMDIQRQYPKMAEEENVATVIEQIDSAFAKKILETAEYYQRTHELKGAVFQYRFLAQTYPNSPEAAEARARLSKMPASALAEAPPSPASSYVTATQPSASAN
jgi:outer membrane protein assembly factor BamD (BamD/ComL family)